jgi:hypothetical protein
MEHVNTLCGPNAECFYVKAGGIYSYRCFKGIIAKGHLPLRFRRRIREQLSKDAQCMLPHWHGCALTE